jgi:hypothetical protein
VNTKPVHVTALTAQAFTRDGIAGVAATIPTPTNIAAGQTAAFQFVIGGINARQITLAKYFVS